MGDYPLLTSRQNPRIKQAIRLRERRVRDQSDRFLIEGYRELLRAAESSYPIETLFICRDLFLGVNEEALVSRLTAAGCQTFSTTTKLFHKLSYRDRPDGLLAVAMQLHRSFTDLSTSPDPLFVVAEAIEKPGNLGTILRACDAAGASGLLLCDRCTDLYNPNVVRASVGTLFTVPVVETTGEEAFAWLKSQGIAIVAATPAAAFTYTKADLRGPVAIAVGTEQLGLSEKWLRAADIQANIPMRGAADSLNVAIATSLLLYEAVRQRDDSL